MARSVSKPILVQMLHACGCGALYAVRRLCAEQGRERINRKYFRAARARVALSDEPTRDPEPERRASARPSACLVWLGCAFSEPEPHQQARANGDTARYRGARSRVALSDGQPRDPETEAPRTDSGFAPTGRKNLSPRLGVGRDYLRKTLREGDELATNSISAGEWRRAFTDLRLPVNHAPDDPPTFSLWPGLSGPPHLFGCQPACCARRAPLLSITDFVAAIRSQPASQRRFAQGATWPAGRLVRPAPPYWGANLDATQEGHPF